MFLPSASKLDLAYRCTFPWTGRVRWPPRTASAAADYGTAVSRVAEALVCDTKADVTELALDEAARKRLAGAAILLKAHLELDDDAERVAELALAYHVADGTARPLVSKGPRDYSDVRPGELVGTLDLLRHRRDGRYCVRDWKTGRYMRGVRPLDSGQLRFLGLAAARHLDVQEIDIELAQVDDDGIFVSPPDTLDAFTLAGVADELRELWARIEAGGVPVPGRWCAEHYCPIASECPATKAALAAIDKATELRFPLSGEFQSDEHAAYVRERLQAVSKFVEIRDAELLEYLKRGPIPIGGGRVWGLREHTRESIALDVAGAADRLRAALGEFGFGVAVEQKTSKAAIHRAAVGQASKRGEAKRIEDALFEELRGLGAVRESVYTKAEEWVPKEAEETTP